ncbi:unnamed protein product [Lactuca saligna]|uniref:Uncharacterized protein n=1 Tax=Lactuca saligna TaxID=75948 RepID=A0AA35VK09_LACSI|nr:unnamed protein product [Lactuca saligna]
MTNSPPRLNQHIHFSSTSTSSTNPSADDIIHHGSSPPEVETIDPLIHVVSSPRPASPSPQVATVPPMPIPIQTIATFKGETSSNFQMIMISKISLLVHMTLSLGE